MAFSGLFGEGRNCCRRFATKIPRVGLSENSTGALEISGRWEMLTKLKNVLAQR